MPAILLHISEEKCWMAKKINTDRVRMFMDGYIIFQCTAFNKNICIYLFTLTKHFCILLK